MIRSLAIAALLVSAPMMAVAAKDTTAGLVDMLRVIPPSERAWQSQPVFSYVDFRALEAVAGVSHPDFEVWPFLQDADQVFADWSTAQREAWLSSMYRIVLSSSDLVSYVRQVGRIEGSMADAVGVDFFTVDRALRFWDASQGGSVEVLAGDRLTADVEEMRSWSSLRSRGFSLSEIDGVPVWHRFDDNAVALSLIDEHAEADPFDRNMNASVRLAVLPDWMIVTGDWPDLEAVLPYAEDASSSGLHRLMAPMVSAVLTLDGVDHRIVQASAVAAQHLDVSAPAVDRLIAALMQSDDGELDAAELQRLLHEEGPEGPQLPLYPVALFVDLQAGRHQVNAIALPYPDRPSAELAAAVVAERLSTWVWEGHGDASIQPVVAEVGGTIETAVTDAAGLAPAIFEAFLAMAGPQDDEADVASRAARIEALRRADDGATGAVAVVAVRYPMPKRNEEEWPGRVLREWVVGIIYQGFTPLVVN